MLDPEIKAMLEFLESAGYPPMDEGSPEDARKGFRAMSVDLVRPEQVVPVDSVEDVDAAGLPARLYRPENPVATIVFFHGGGFVIGDLDTHDQTCRRLANDTSATVLSVDYRLAPEHAFPAAVDDAIAATRWAIDNMEGPFAVAGDSAGGNLSAVVAQELRGELTGQLLIYPAVDAFGDYASREENKAGYFLTLPMMEWFFGHYAGAVEGLTADDPRHSPLHGDLSGLPPAVVVTAEFDPLRDEGEAYAEALRAAGTPVEQVRFDGLIHGFVDMGPFSASAAAAVTEMNARFAALLR